MNKPKTHVALVIDKSSSMSSIAKTAISGFNEHIQQVKAQEKEGHDIRCSVISFNDTVEENVWNVKASDVNEITDADYRPSGLTALLDAMGYTLTKLQKLAKEDKETAFLVVVISDGDTNSDRNFGSNQIRELVSGCELDKRWTIAYIGCSGPNAEHVASMTGIKASNLAFADFSDDKAFEKSVTRGLNSNSLRYFAGRTEGLVSMSYCSTTGQMANWSDPQAVMTTGTTATNPVNVVVDPQEEAAKASKTNKSKP